jgi:hypothetical protein
MSNYKKWKEVEIKKLKRLYISEKLLEEVMEAFPERTENAVRLKASRLGLKRPELPSVLMGQSTILHCSEGNGNSKGYIFRCCTCGTWTQINEKDEISNSLIVCEKCR